MKRTALITIASLLAVIASIFTFSYFQKGSNEPQNTINTTIEPKDTAQIPETVPEEPKILESDLDTSTWKTYRNDEFGFEVKYPKDWKKPTVDGEGEYFSATLSPLSFSEGCCSGVKIRFWTLPTIESYTNADGDVPLSDTKVVVSGIVARQLVMNSHYGIKNVKTIVIPFKNTTLMLVYGDGDKVADAVASTFKILNQ